MDGAGLPFGVLPVRGTVGAPDFAAAQFLGAAGHLHRKDGDAVQPRHEVRDPRGVFPDDVIRDDPRPGPRCGGDGSVEGFRNGQPGQGSALDHGFVTARAALQKMIDRERHAAQPPALVQPPLQGLGQRGLPRARRPVEQDDARGKTRGPPCRRDSPCRRGRGGLHSLAAHGPTHGPTRGQPRVRLHGIRRRKKRFPPPGPGRVHLRYATNKYGHIRRARCRRPRPRAVRRSGRASGRAADSRGEARCRTSGIHAPVRWGLARPFPLFSGFCERRPCHPACHWACHWACHSACRPRRFRDRPCPCRPHPFSGRPASRRRRGFGVSRPHGWPRLPSGIGRRRVSRTRPRRPRRRARLKRMLPLCIQESAGVHPCAPWRR